MVTNISSQLQGSFPLRRAAGSFEISFTKWLRGTKPVHFAGDFRLFSELEEHQARFAEVSESDVENLIEEEENANTKKKRPCMT